MFGAFNSYRRRGVNMNGGWRYRVGSAVGVAVLTAVAVTVVNSPTGQEIIGTLPVLSRLSSDPPTGIEGVYEVVATVAVVTGVFFPLYKPRPRRILDTIGLAQKRLLVATFALAAIGYFDYTYRLPRQTLLAVTPILLVVLPLWFVWIRRRPGDTSERAIIVGDDPQEVQKLAADVETPLVGYLSDGPVRSGNCAEAQRDLHEAVSVLDGQCRSCEQVSERCVSSCHVAGQSPSTAIRRVDSSGRQLLRQ